MFYQVKHAYKRSSRTICRGMNVPIRKFKNIYVHDGAEKLAVGVKVVGRSVGDYTDASCQFGIITKFSKGRNRFTAQLVEAIRGSKQEITNKFTLTPNWDVVLRDKTVSVPFPLCYRDWDETCWDIYDETKVYFGNTRFSGIKSLNDVV